MCCWMLTADTEELIVRGTVRSASNTTRPNLQTDAAAQQTATNPGEQTEPTADRKQNNSDHEDEQEQALPLIEKETQEFQTRELTIPKLPIAVDPEDLINKIVYFGDKKAKKN